MEMHGRGAATRRLKALAAQLPAAAAGEAVRIPPLASEGWAGTQEEYDRLVWPRDAKKTLKRGS
jgi:hypothetical protein